MALGGQVGRGGEVHAVPASTAARARPTASMGQLRADRRTVRSSRFPGLQKPERGQVAHQLLVDPPLAHLTSGQTRLTILTRNRRAALQASDM